MGYALRLRHNFVVADSGKDALGHLVVALRYARAGQRPDRRTGNNVEADAQLPQRLPDADVV